MKAPKPKPLHGPAPDFFSPGFVAVRRWLRKLWDQYPDAFEDVMRAIILNGEHWRKILPPMAGKGTKPQQVTRRMLALLLADFRNWNTTHGKGARKDFKASLAENGCRYGNPYFVGKWRTSDAVEKQLRAAENLAKHDVDFDAEVESWRPALMENADEQSPLNE
jgi:hypothetical protein